MQPYQNDQCDRNGADRCYIVSRARCGVPQECAKMSSSRSRKACRCSTSEAAYASCASLKLCEPQSLDCCCFDRSMLSTSRTRSFSPCRSEEHTSELQSLRHLV